MKTTTWYRNILVLCLIVLSTADDIYGNNLTKLWSLSSASKSDGSAVVNVTSASIVIQPTNYGDRHTTATRKTKDLKLSPVNYSYVFKPRSIPVREDEQPQVEKNVYYKQNNVNEKYNTEIPFSGNYLQIAKLKGDDPVKESPYNPLNDGAFRPRAIPLIWNPQFQARSLSEDEEPILEKPEEFSEQTASKRSLSYVFGADDDEEEPDEEDEEEENEYELEEVDDKKHPHSHIHAAHNKKKLRKKTKKVTKYMMPLLLAYKLKYFALVPVMIAGLLLLIGSTGLAGFFFALFAAVMGLQKGSY